MNRVRNEDLPVLLDTSVLLRPICADDTDLVVRWRNSEAVKQNFVIRQDITAEDHRKWYETRVLQGDVIQYIIVEAKTMTPIGSIYYRDVDYTHNHAEFGIFIGEEGMQGKGYGKQAIKTFVEFGLKHLGLHKIFLRVFADNYKAIKTYSTIGFQLEGIARDLVYVDEQYKTMFFMAITQGL